ncbi:MAG: aspartate aminotransferase family protein [Alphaproteobacteria bacterium]|nr:aspartate aminotransferase family protein [Alphaproteobacteria bacterium]
MNDCLFANYARFDVVLSHGQGSYLYDIYQTAYLDFATGIAVSALGHQHPELTKALSNQVNKLLHCSNLYRIPQQEALAEMLCQHSFADKVMFCNSGLEANEAALKLVRKYQHQRGKADKHRFLAVDGAFHGRSLALISASPEGKMIEGFAPLPDCFDIAPADDLAALEAAITPQTAAIILEPLQGDGGGIHLFPNNYLQGVRALCDQHDLSLVLDEIQCGNGRTGTLWCYEHSGIIPDIMTTAKGLGGGMPIGAVLAREEIASALTPGSHGTTFGGNPLASTAGLAVLSELTRPGFLETVRARGDQLANVLDTLVAKYHGVVSEKLGLGLMQGLRCVPEVSNINLVRTALKTGLLLVPAGRNVVRILPPLTVSESEIDQAATLMHSALSELAS